MEKVQLSQPNASTAFRDLLFEEPDPDEAPRAKKPRFPKGKKEFPGESAAHRLAAVDGEEDGATVLSTDPRLAAKERAIRRSALAEQQLINSEDLSVINDVAAAEEEGGVDRIEDGIQIEPFNLTQEREEGYFDAEGNYVEYANDDDLKDAWLESAKVDERFAGKLKTKVEEEDADLTKEEIWTIQRRISDALLPEETVLQALRRLKGSSSKDGKRGERMTEATQIMFDRLTEDAMKLLDNGDYNVYHDLKETFQREAEGYEALARARGGDSIGAGVLGSSHGTNGIACEDILNTDDDKRQIAPSATPVSTAGRNGEEYRVLARERYMYGVDNAFLNFVGTDHLPIRRGMETGDRFQVDMFGGGDDAFDMFGDDENNASRNGGAGAANVVNTALQQGGEAPAEGTGYVYDESSGYYYNSEVGYYYDGNTGLFCCAASGKWFSYDEGSNSYVEIPETPETQG